LKKLEVQAEVFTGQQTVDEKRAIFSRFKNRDEDRDKELDIDILVATKAFGVGVDVPHVRNVVHIGFPSNMSDLIQAWGRAGRDGKDAHAFLFFNEYNDLKSLSYFTKNMTATEKMARYQHFSDVFEFYSSVFIGACLRQSIRRYFGDQELLQNSNGDCCEGCKIKGTLQFAENRKIHGVAQTLSFFEDSRLMKVYEKQLVSWWRADEGNDGNWMSAYFNDHDKKDHSTYGIQQEKSKEETKVLFKGLLRQMLALGYVRIEFQPLPQSDIMTKVWFLSDSGRKLGKASDEELAECLPQLPDPVQVVKFLSRYLHFFYYLKAE
jgi:superfamily II DNA helicase RecQ